MWLEIVSLSVLSPLVMSSTFSFTSSAPNTNDVITCTDDEACTITCTGSSPQCDYVPGIYTPILYHCPSNADCTINLYGGEGLMYGATIYAQDSTKLILNAVGSTSLAYLTIYCPTAAANSCQLTASGGRDLFDGVTVYKDTASGVNLSCEASNYTDCLGLEDSFKIKKSDLNTVVCIIDFVASSPPVTPVAWNCETPDPTRNPSSAPTPNSIATSPIYRWYPRAGNIHFYATKNDLNTATFGNLEGIAFQVPTNDADVSGYDTIDLNRWKQNYEGGYKIYILEETAGSEWTLMKSLGKCFTLTGNKHPAAVELFRYKNPYNQDTLYTTSTVEANSVATAGWIKESSPCYVFPSDYGSSAVLPRLHVAPMDVPRSMHFDFNNPNFGFNTFVCVVLALFVMGSCALTVAVLDLSNKGGRRKKIVVGA